MFAPLALRQAPAKKILAGLTLVVLLGHWLALGGRIDLWPDAWFKTPSALGPLPTQAPTTGEMPALSPTPALPDLPKPVTVATVRWIAPPPPPPEPDPVAPEPEPTPPPFKPVKIAKKKVEEPPPAPAVIETPVPEPLPVAEPPAPVATVEPTPTPPPLPPLPQVVQTPAPDKQATVSPAAAQTDTNKAEPAPSVTLAPNAALNYDVKGKAKGFDYHASGTLVWQQNGGVYEARLEVSALFFGSYVQLSTGATTAEGIAPERFSIKRRNSEKAAHFERSTGRIRYSNNAPDAPLLPGAQDRLSVVLQLAALLNTYPRLSDAGNVSLPVSGDSSSESWQFEVGKMGPLKLPAGNLNARLLTRAPRREFDQTVQLWLAPDLGHLPVRMRLTESNGDFLDLLLEELPPITPPTQTPTNQQGKSIP